MKLIRSFSLFLFVVVIVAYGVSMFAISFLFPEKENYIPNLKIGKKNSSADEYTLYKLKQSKELWYYSDDKTNLDEFSWSFNYDQGKAYFSSISGHQVNISNIYEINAVSWDIINSSQERFLIGYSSGGIDVFVSGNDQSLLRTHIDIIYPVIFLSNIDSRIFSLVLDDDFFPQALWFSSININAENGEQAWENNSIIRLTEKIGAIGNGFVVDEVGIFLNVDTGILFFSSDMTTINMAYNFSTCREVLGNNDFYVIEYVTGDKLFFDVYINQKKKFTWEMHYNNIIKNIDSISIVKGERKITEENKEREDTLYPSDNLSQEQLSRSQDSITLYRVSKTKKAFEFKKGTDIYLVELP